MKTKIFALMISLLCLCVIFTACKKDACETHVDENADGVCDVCEAAIESNTETDTEAVCEHKDENANKICDVCEKALVTMTVVAPAETEPVVDMVVNQAPADAKAEDYIRTEPMADKIYTKSELDGSIYSRYGSYAVLRKAVDTNYSFKVVDLATEAVLVDAGTNAGTDTTTKEIDVSWGNEYFAVTVNEFNTFYEHQKSNVGYYTYAGKEIAKYSWTRSTDSVTPDSDFAPAGSINDTYYFTFDGKKYAVDANTDTVIHSDEILTFVERPTMDGIQGNYGYIETLSDVKVYDLSKWIECVYTYDIPDNAAECDIWQLANGNVLVQYVRQLADIAVNYDYIENGDKYDVVYVIVDAASKSAKEVEFGYIIDDIYLIDDQDALFTDKVDNLFVVETIDTELEKTLVVGNDLTVLYEVKLDIYAWPVGGGLYVQYFGFNDVEYVQELVDINGTHKAYISDAVAAGEGYKFMDGKFYTYDDVLLVDILDGNMPIAFGEEFYVFSKDEGVAPNIVTKYYYYGFGSAAPVEIGAGKADFTVVNSFDGGYIVSYTANGNTVYELYDANNIKLADVKSNLNFNDTVDAEGNVIYYAEATVGGVTTTYIVK